MPVRIQRKRVRGWRMPEGAVYVGRPTPFGNPFVTSKHGTQQECATLYARLMAGLICISRGPSLEEMVAAREFTLAHLDELRGKDLACFCRLDQPCHADVLLELANR